MSRLKFFIMMGNGILNLHQPPYGFDTEEQAQRWARNRFLHDYTIVED